MCGRFTLAIDPADLQDSFPEFTFPSQITPRYNIAPTQPILVLPNDGTKKADFFTWGLIPSWAKDPVIGSRLINARAETLAEKPSFRSAYKYRRCIIFADGFFEWQSIPGKTGKVPNLIRLKSGKPFALAGLWERWQSPDGSEIKSATIITTTPNELMAPIHDRMPVILPSHAYTRWLGVSPQFPVDLKDLLVPFPAGEMRAFHVKTLVNNPGEDRPEMVVPV
jgi:putative SOS response-associated peptidase YedK